MLDDDLLNLVKLQLDELNIHSRKMFGGIGIFSEKIMFSLIYDGKLYFRSTEEAATRYSSESIQFQHPSRGSKMPYWSVPEKIIKDKNIFIDWAKNALQFAVSLKRKQLK